MQIKKPIDIFLTHDWPRNIYNYGNTAQLLARKQFFREEVWGDGGEGTHWAEAGKGRGGEGGEGGETVKPRRSRAAWSSGS